MRKQLFCSACCSFWTAVMCMPKLNQWEAVSWHLCLETERVSPQMKRKLSTLLNPELHLNIFFQIYKTMLYQFFCELSRLLENHPTVEDLHFLIHQPGANTNDTGLGIRPKTWREKKERLEKRTTCARLRAYITLDWVKKVKAIGKTPHVPWSTSL